MSKTIGKGAWALVTGASSGIGAEYARQLAERGMNVLVSARRLDRLEKLSTDLKSKYGVEVFCIKNDLGEPGGARELFEKAIAGGRKIQILINNAGVGSYGPFHKRPLDKQLGLIQVNVTALTELTHRFTTHMLDHGLSSHITNVASIAAYQSVAYFAVYSGTKSFVRALSETLSSELKDTNISVTCVCPGGTTTEFMEQAGEKLNKAGEAMMMTPEKVVRLGLRSMDQGRVVVVTGFINQVATLLPRLLPSRVAMNIATFFMRRSVTMVEDTK